MGSVALVAGIALGGCKGDLHEQILEKPTLADAVEFAKPRMVDALQESSEGSKLLTAWAIKRLTWKDVDTAVNESSFAKAQKDPDAEKGKRMCVSGRINQINVRKDPRGTYYSGFLSDRADDTFRIHAVMDTGEIAQGSAARFCGVLTGRYDYRTSAGGIAHAIELVGMFDLPANREH